MPETYIGSTAGITPRQNASVTLMVGTDVRSSNSVRTPLQQLANVAQYLMTKSGLLDVVSTWTAKQTMSGGVGGLPAPTAGGDAATKTYADGLITTLLAAAQTWAAKQTFSVGQDVTGTIALVQAALQQIVKTGAGKLQVGTATGNANDLELLVAGAVKLALLNAGGVDAKTQRILNVADPSAAQDAATKAYVDAKFVAPTWATPTLLSGWTNGTGASQVAYTKTSDGRVHLRGTAIYGGGNGSIFQLPAGYRPPADTDLPAVRMNGGAGSHATVQVFTDGDVYSTYPAGEVLHLTGISFFPA
jgi:hypothetical protein